MLDLVPALICGLLSLAVMFAQEYNSKCKAVKAKTEGKLKPIKWLR